jgi:molecular chaperone GrpE
VEKKMSSKEKNEKKQNEAEVPQETSPSAGMEAREELPEVEAEEKVTGTPEELATRCKELEEEKDQLFARLQRSVADLQNYQKKAIKERQESVARAELNAIERFLLPMIDDLDRAIQAANGSGYKKDDILYTGVDMVRQHTFMLLKQIGIEPLEDPTGKIFDPLYHEAIMEVPTNEKPEKTVMYILSRGYTQHGKTIRPTRVAVAKPIKKEQTEEKPQNEPEGKKE